MKIIYLALLLTLSLPAHSEDPKVKALADTSLSAAQALRLQSLKTEAARYIEQRKEELLKTLDGKPAGTGVLFDVQIFEHPEGHLAKDGPLWLGSGQSQIDIIMRSEKRTDIIRNQVPKLHKFSSSKSYMIWVTLEGKKVKAETMSPLNRELAFTKVGNLLRAEQEKKREPKK